MGRYFFMVMQGLRCKEYKIFQEEYKTREWRGGMGLLIKLPLNRQNTNKVWTQNKLHENIVSTKDPTPASRVKSV